MANDDLVKRLRDTAFIGTPDFTNSPIMREAADALEAKAKRIAELEERRRGLIHVVSVHDARITEIEAENAKLREALKPFVDRLAELEKIPNAAKYGAATDVDLAHLRAARAAIAAIRPHIEAVEREKIAETIKNWGDDPHFQLLAAAIRSGK